MTPKAVVAFVVIPANRRFFQRAVHTFDLAVGPGMEGLGQSMLNVLLSTGQFE